MENKYYKILLVDDDLTSIYLTQMMIEDVATGWVEEIYIAENGKQALDIISKYCLPFQEKQDAYCPGLILLDINMPVMNGFEFLEELQKLNNLKHKDTKIVMLSSSANPRDMKRAKEYGVTSYLQKPLSEQAVKELFSNPS